MQRSSLGAAGWLMAACGWLALAAGAVASEPEMDPLDWPHWRGPELNGMSREKHLPSSWDPRKGTNVLWKKEALGTISSPIVMRGKVYTLARHNPETTREGEKVICADAITGETLWENSWNVYLTDAPAERVGWSSVVGDLATGNVYALGLNSVFTCIDGETGKTLWQRSLSEETGLLSTYGGRTNIPFLFEDLVVISGVMTGWDEHAVPAQRFLAFKKLTGEYVWITSTKVRPPDTTYSTPVLAVFNGQAAMVFGSSDGNVYALQPRTGKVIWTYEASIRGINQTPLVVGNTVFCGFSEEDLKDNSIMGGFFALDGSGEGKARRLWNFSALASGRAAPLLIGDKVYATTDNARLYILDAKTGKQLVRETKFGTISMGSPAYGDGKLYVPEKSGRFFIYQVGDKGLKELSRVGPLRDEQFDASPAISHGRVYIASTSAMYCIAASADPKPEADPRPETPREAAVEDQKPAQLQIVPVESLIRTGETQVFEARLFNARGQFLKTVEAKYTVAKGPGKVDAKGVFAAPTEAKHAAAFVTAEAEGVKATARVRVVPPLPWKFDFSDKEVPITWIGARYRHVFREVEGEPLIAKITTIPLGTRSQSWMGPTNLHDYTVQADVRGGKNKTNGKLPDIGLINSRYTLDLMGVEQSLQIRSWTSRLELRFAETRPFPWKPDTWYTLKFQSQNKDGAIVLRGKVWPRGEKEPEAWAIEATDTTPNTHGSPGLFGMSTVAEIFIDNVIVTANP